MKKINKIFSCLVCFVLISGMIFNFSAVKAASFGISASTGSVAPGGSFTVNVGGDCTGRVNLSVSNGSLSTNSVWVEGNYALVTVTAGSSGSVTVTATPEKGMSDSDGNEYAPGARSVSVGIVANNNTGGGGSNSGGSNTQNNTQTQQPDDTRSANTNLASLAISEGTLSPEFNADTTEYSVSLAADVTKISVSASAADEKATVSGTGEVELKAGENKISVTVTAENQTTKTYTITANVDEKPLVYTELNDKKLGVVRNTDGLTIPSTFEESTVKIDGKDVKAWTSESMKLTLVYLIDEETGEKNFYIYDTKAKEVTSVFKPVAILGHNVFIVDIAEEEQKLEGFKYKKVTIDNTELMGWEFKNSAFKNYSLIYVMDENGKMQYYQYEKTQNTLQLYSGSAPITQETYEELVNDLNGSNTLKYVFMGLTGLFALTTIAGAVMIVKLRKSSL